MTNAHAISATVRFGKRRKKKKRCHSEVRSLFPNTSHFRIDRSAHTRSENANAIKRTALQMKHK